MSVADRSLIYVYEKHPRTHANTQLRAISSTNKPTLDVPSVGCHGKSGPPVVSSLSVPPSPLCSTTLYYSSRHVPHLYHSVTPYVGSRFCRSLHFVSLLHSPFLPSPFPFPLHPSPTFPSRDSGPPYRLETGPQRRAR